MTKKIARGLDIGRTASKMSAKATQAETSGRVWEKEFAKGTTNWAYWMRIISPYVNAIGVSPLLSAEQRQIAVKEFFKRVKKGLPLFLSGCADASMTFATKVAVVTASPPVTELIV